MATWTLVHPSNSGFVGRVPSRRGMSPASVSASTSRGQQGQPPSERAAKTIAAPTSAAEFVLPE
eukprot:1506651-Alexandrium_andersonii.AAC.1